MIEKFVEVNKVKIFEDNDYQKLRGKGKYNLHSVSGLPTFRGSKHRSWNRITHSLENDIERLKLPSSETHSRECNEAFSKARDKLLSEAIDSLKVYDLYGVIREFGVACMRISGCIYSCF